MRHPPRVYRRRRAAVLAVPPLLAVLVVAALSAGGDAPEQGDAEREGTAAAPRPEPPELPRGGRHLFPDFRVVAFYGAPQDPELGALGIGSPAEAARRLERQARPYARGRRPVLPAMHLIAVVAAAHGGEDGKYRMRQPDRVIGRYLRAARRARALLLLDIQPGHADFMEEARRLRRWLDEPDVGLALDPEWHTPGVPPGSEIGSVTAEKVNEVSRWLAGIVRRRDLPEKPLVLHQFTHDMIRGKGRLRDRPGLALTINADGFGSRPSKVSKYRAFTSEAPRLHEGLKLFYEEDANLMRPRQVLRLDPPPDLVIYE